SFHQRYVCRLNRPNAMTNLFDLRKLRLEVNGLRKWVRCDSSSQALPNNDHEKPAPRQLLVGPAGHCCSLEARLRRLADRLLGLGCGGCFFCHRVADVPWRTSINRVVERESANKNDSNLEF